MYFQHTFNIHTSIDCKRPTANFSTNKSIFKQQNAEEVAFAATRLYSVNSLNSRIDINHVSSNQILTVNLPTFYK